VFGKLSLSKKIALGYLFVISVMVLLSFAVSISLKNVADNSDIVAKEFNPGVEVLSEMYDGLSEFFYCGNYYYISQEDSFYLESVQLEKTMDDIFVKIYELLKTSKHLVLLQDGVDGLYKGINASKKYFHSLNESLNEKKRLNESLTNNGESMIERIKVLKSKFQTETKEWTAVSNAENCAVSMQFNHLIFKTNREAGKKAAEYKALLLENLKTLENYNIPSDSKINLVNIFKIVDSYTSEMDLLTVEHLKSETLFQDFLLSQSVLEELNDIYYADSETGGENAKFVSDSLHISILILLTGAILSIVLGTVLCIIITSSIVKPIKAAINGLSESSSYLTLAAGEISNTSQEMANGANEQAANLEEISSSLNEITSTTKQTADNVKNVDILVKDSVDKAKASQDVMNRLQNAVVEIQRSSNETAKILKDIDEIAFQTNLLALNAAVEAARAGEFGKGFAVVAEEVRNLAQRSAESAKRTAQLIEGSQASSSHGVNLAKETTEAIGKITEASNKIAMIVNDITISAQEQARGVSQVNSAIRSMDQITQSNTSGSQELAEGSQELNSQSLTMNGLVGDLVGVVGGETAKTERLKRHNTMVMERKTRHIKKISTDRNLPEKFSDSRTLISFDDDKFGNY
jgi:methyl-accepting chemotaxis protein